jgi:hypothetical protein
MQADAYRPDFDIVLITIVDGLFALVSNSAPQHHVFRLVCTPFIYL